MSLQGHLKVIYTPFLVYSGYISLEAIGQTTAFWGRIMKLTMFSLYTLRFKKKRRNMLVVLFKCSKFKMAAGGHIGKMKYLRITNDTIFNGFLGSRNQIKMFVW